VHFHKQADKMNHEAHIACHSQNKAASLIRLNKNHGKILKLLQFENFQLINPDF